MNRSSFLRSLFVVVASPKIIAQLDFTPNPEATSNMLKGMNLLVPDYYNKLIQKYGNQNYTLMMDILNKQTVEIPRTYTFSHYETRS